MDLCTKGLGQSIPALKVLWIFCLKEDMFRGRYQIDFFASVEAEEYEETVIIRLQI